MAKALARAGVASRREVERLIAEGRVALNGRVLDTPAVRIGLNDILTVNGEPVADAEPTRVWRYHKPVGLLTTHNDPQGRPTVFEHLPEGLPRVISVGRLDINSEGLLLLTNDGALARALELPATGWVRRYRARAYGRVDQARLDRLKEGVTVEGVRYGPIEARLDKAQHRDGDRSAPANVWITVALTEGKNREVRRVLEHLGLKVNRLLRLAYGPFALGTLDVGAAEEVGPRVIREQLAELIPTENLPKGDRTAGPLLAASSAAPGRRRREPDPAQAGGKGEPGRGRASRGPASRSDAEPQPAPEKKTYKAGWAKPKVRARPAGAPQRKPKPEGGPTFLDSPSVAARLAGRAKPSRPAAPRAPGKPRPSPGGAPRGGGKRDR